ncbi:translesion DNA synthesis-associated protein ImuA [Caldimonas brevitalea]|uniref:Translesion DNA synthesis-associated protein ImuA n=1 Tax=Caldimonas brevitalea TaxID=413882 RepID=A0A0G3BL84_9BURK|nr:translesion DNA synthesis-associated protein ImuA [Caldimonas brevitalea]AKJ30224.1 hypothetical protein AAW51_3533 [Caldimonas brevitalea]
MTPDLLPSASTPTSDPDPAPPRLPPSVAAALWRGDELGGSARRTVPSGYDDLDRELPGGGWPAGVVVELLQAQPCVGEWRLLMPVLGRLAAEHRPIWLVGAPHLPYLPGLRAAAGLTEQHLIRVCADTPAQRLWATEQGVKAQGLGAVLAWLPQARPEQVRRLQACAAQSDTLVFLMRPAAVQREASASPLRLQVQLGDAWSLQVRLLKRRGPCHEGVLVLPSVPSQLAPVVAARLRPSVHRRLEPAHAVLGGLDSLPAVRSSELESAH